MSGGKKRARDPDKDSSHNQVSRPGQLNTESDPSTHAKPLGERDPERQNGGGGVWSVKLFLKVVSLEAADVLKMVKHLQDGAS